MHGPEAGAVTAGWAAEGAGGRAGAGERVPGDDTGTNTSGNGALRGDKACGSAGAGNASNGDDFSDCRGGSSSNSIAGWHGMDGDGGSGGEGGEEQLSICGIGLFLDKTAARLLARVASLNVFTLFLGRGAGCGGGDPFGGGDTIGGGDAGWDRSACADGEVAEGAVETPAPATLASAMVCVLSSSIDGV